MDFTALQSSLSCNAPQTSFSCNDLVHRMVQSSPSPSHCHTPTHCRPAPRGHPSTLPPVQLDPSAPAPSPSPTPAPIPTPTPTPASGSGDSYHALNVEAAGQTVGWKGASRAYRKIGEAQAGLEVDPVFLAAMTKPLFRAVCDRAYGGHAAIGVYRAMVMTKPEVGLCRCGHVMGGRRSPDVAEPLQHYPLCAGLSGRWRTATLAPRRR